MTPVTADQARTASTSLAGGVGELQIDTGSFDISAEAKADLVGAFHTEMGKLGIPVTSAGAPATLQVTEFNTRSVAARIMFGALAGSDHIKGTVKVAGAEFDVADTGVSVMGGLGVVARDVGVQTADGIGHLAGVTAK